jgi:AraC-like DNA-binding protein
VTGALDRLVALDAGQPTVLSGWTATLVRALDDQGYDGAALAAEAGIDPAALGVAHARVPLTASTRLWASAARVTDNPTIGLDVARYVRPTTFHSLGQAVLASPTLREGLERMARFSRVVADPAESATLASGDRFAFIIRWRPGVPPPSDHSIDAILATVVSQCRLMLDDSVTPLQVQVRRDAPPSPARYAAFFGCPVTFSARDSRLVFDRSVVERRLPAGEIELARRNDEVVGAYLASLEGQKSLSACVRAALVSALPSGPPTAPAIARALATSSRSLQRHLADEGVTFRELLQEVRCDVAKSYLRSGTHTIAETAALLGFSDVTAFSRAFKRWTGTSPSRFS